MRKGELEADADRMMREYRAQLDAERARKLAHGRNHSGGKSKHGKGTCDKCEDICCVSQALNPIFSFSIGEGCLFCYLQIRGTNLQRSMGTKRERCF